MACALPIRQVTGREEFTVSGTDTANAVRLIASLTGDAASAARLNAGERDSYLASVYQRTFGDRIQSTAKCSACSSPFDLDFSLADLRAKLAETARSTEVEDEKGVWLLPTDVRFRVPTGEDELAVSQMSPREAEHTLIARCLIDDAGCPDAAKQMAEALENIAPLLSLDLQAACPECGAVQSLHFDVQAFLLRRIAGARRQLLADIHRLASSYGWTLESILSLPRADRKCFVSLIDGELAPRAGSFA